MQDAALKAQKQRLIRIGRILRYFLDNEAVITTNLAKHLGFDVRTVQRDLRALRDAGMPIHEVKKGTYRLKKDLIKYNDLSQFKESELALIVALKDLVSQLGAPFEEAAEVVLNKLCDDAVHTPVYVKIEGGFRLNAATMTKLIDAIRLGRQVAFSYNSDTPHAVIAHPYRVAYYDGFWYLIARDTNDKVIKKYALDKIGGVKKLKEEALGMPKDLDETLSKSINIWFSGERTKEVLIEVDHRWAHYFQRRDILPLQKILSEQEDGSLIVGFMACSNEEIAMCLKPWLPHVRVLSPRDVRNLLVKEYTQWIQWQGDARKPRARNCPRQTDNPC